MALFGGVLKVAKVKFADIFFSVCGGCSMSGAAGCAVDHLFYCSRDETVSGN